MFGCEAGRFQHLVDPGAELAQVHTSPRSTKSNFNQAFLTLPQVQSIDAGLPGGVAQHASPETCAVQHAAQSLKPLRQRTAALQGRKQSRHRVGQGLGSRLRRTDLPPLAQAVLAQLFFSRSHGGGVKHRCVFKPVEHGIRGHIPGGCTQQAHDARRSAGR